jgi:hypothetical protein
MELSFISASPCGFMIEARFGRLLIEVAVPGAALRQSQITPYFQVFKVSPKIHSMHSAKLDVNFHFRRKKS